MFHTNNPIIKHKAGLLNLASELQNVSKACKIMGVSRDTFYRYQELVETDGLEGLINRERRVPNLKNRVDKHTEQAVIGYAVDFPAHGQHRTSNELRKRGVFISGSGVRSIWLRHKLENFKGRLSALEAKVANEGLVLSDAQIVALERKHEKVLPFYTSHDLPMLRILTDRGTEYCGKEEQHDYQLYLAIHDIEHTKTKAMSPQTNGICERFHKTILQEFYQVTFRKKLYADVEPCRKI